MLVAGVHPHRWNMVEDLAEMVPQKLWTYLHEKFGGGPAVNHLYQCDTCQNEMDKLKRRQRSEMETFVEVRNNCPMCPLSYTVFLYCCSDFPECPIHLNSISWATWAIWAAKRDIHVA